MSWGASLIFFIDGRRLERIFLYGVRACVCACIILFESSRGRSAAISLRYICFIRFYKVRTGRYYCLRARENLGRLVVRYYVSPRYRRRRRRGGLLSRDSDVLFLMGVRARYIMKRACVTFVFTKLIMYPIVVIFRTLSSARRDSNFKIILREINTRSTRTVH